MDYPFSKEESVSRKQFWNFFGGKYLIPTTAKDAINEDAWSPNVVNEILHKLFPENVMTPDDIYMAACMVGILGIKDEGFYFKYNWESGLTSDIVNALSPYIFNSVWVNMKQRLSGVESTASEEFYISCCSDPQIKPVKMSTAHLYEIFVIWCEKNGRVPTTNRDLFKYLKSKGHTMYKGYLHGICGANYFRLPISFEEVDKVVKPKSQRIAEEEEQIKKELKRLVAKIVEK